MLFGYFGLKRHYNQGQVVSRCTFSGIPLTWALQLAVIVVTAGVITTTVLKPSKRLNAEAAGEGQNSYALGILFLTLSSILSGYMGLLQERTYLQYGRCWQEGLFYTVCVISTSSFKVQTLNDVEFSCFASVSSSLWLHI